MSEIQARSQPSPARGRGGSRGGRGGFAGRGGASRRANGDKSDSPADASFEEDSDIGQLRKRFAGKIDPIRELFPDWSDADILYALEETDGDLELAAARISDGSVSQWGEVSKPKKPSAKPKAKDSAATSTVTDSAAGSRPARGGRSERGGRGRGAERARGSRGRATVATTTNGHRKESQPLSVPTDDAWANATAATNDEEHEPVKSVWGAKDSSADKTATSTPATTNTPATSDPTTKPAAAPQGGKTWASMLRQSTAPKPAPPKPKEAPAPKPAEAIEPLPPAETTAPEPAPESAPQQEAVKEETPKKTVAVATPKVVEPEIALPMPEDDLTKDNLEQLPDESHPPGTATVASTAADSWDPRQPQQNQAATPLSASAAQHQAARAEAPSGYAATALKATERPTPRTPSYQRRILEQQEAVRMPGNREVDRTAVQFGAFSLNESEDDVDGEREEPETRAQPPQESPSAPRASLPPASQTAPMPESFPGAQKPTTALPQAPGAAGTPVAPPAGPVGIGAQPPQAAANPSLSRFPQANVPEQPGFSQKPYDSFAQQAQAAATSAGTFDSFPAPTSQAHAPQSNAFSSAPGDYSSYYTADQQSRNNYGNYYNQHYGHGAPAAHQDAPGSQNRGFGAGAGAYSASQNDSISQYPQSGAQQSRFPAAAGASEAQNSGHSTPNPPGQAQAATQANQPQSNLHQQPHANYPYGHPYYSSPFYAQYMNQYGGAYGQGGYGGGHFAKGGLYGQPHQYGMSPQGPYGHDSASASSAFGGSSLGGRDSGLGSTMDNYGRASSAQSGAQSGLGGAGFGGMQDTFGRGSGYPQTTQGFNNPNAPTSTAGAADDLKPYGDSKAASGPSPSLAAAARPGSAANSAPGSGLPPPQSAQHGIGGAYGGYPNHLQSHGLHGNQSAASAYGIGASGGQGSGPYGYGGNQGFGYYNGRQQGGWGGNYH